MRRRLWLTCGVGSLHSNSILRSIPDSPRASPISATFAVSKFHTASLRFRSDLVIASSSFLSSPAKIFRVVTSVSSMASGDEGAVFNLSDSSFLKILKGDITKWSVDGTSDAIVSLSLLS